MLRKVHESHLGMDKCKATARSVMYWPNLSSDIENMVTKRSICARGNQLYHIQCQIDHGPSLVPISLTLMERTILYLWTISQNGQKLASSHAKQPAQWYHIWKPTTPDMVYPMNWLPIICHMGLVKWRSSQNNGVSRLQHPAPGIHSPMGKVRKLLAQSSSWWGKP